MHDQKVSLHAFFLLEDFDRLHYSILLFMQTLANVSFGAKIGYFIYQIALFRQLSLVFRSLVP